MLAISPDLTQLLEAPLVKQDIPVNQRSSYLKDNPDGASRNPGQT
jgi:hypothetical protein